MGGSTLRLLVAALISNLFRAFLAVTLVYFPAEAMAKSNVKHVKNRSPKSVENPAEFERHSALDDPMNRINPDFHVPAALKQRTAFWFDIYTLYGSSDNVIHNADYPWIIYKVVNTDEIENNPKLHRFTKYNLSKKAVRTELWTIRKTLKRLSQKSNYNKLTPEEQDLFNLLAEVDGPRQKVFRQAVLSVRTQLGQKDFFKQGLRYSIKYLPHIEQKFADQGLPIELTRLPFVESSFNVEAESKVGASGIWQIMPMVGRAYLRVNDVIDERNSPLKASSVAIALFQQNYHVLKSWPLAITAYNHGAKGVERAVIKMHSFDISDIVGHYSSPDFQFASSNFYVSFLAVLHAERYHDEIFRDFIHPDEKPQEHVVFALKRAARVRQVLKATKLSAQELLSYNLDLKHAIRNNSQLPRGFKLILPSSLAPVIQSKRWQKSGLLQEAALSDIAKKTSG